MTEVEKAWMAGLFDAEGHIQIMRKADKRRDGSDRVLFYLHVDLGLKHDATVQRVLALLGFGTVRTNPRRIKRWQCVSRDAESFLRAIRPYLVTKSDQADLALAYCQLPPASTGRGHRVPKELQAKREGLCLALRALRWRHGGG